MRRCYIIAVEPLKYQYTAGGAGMRIHAVFGVMQVDSPRPASFAGQAGNECLTLKKQSVLGVIPIR